MAVTSYKTAGTVENALYDPLSQGAGSTWTSPTSAQGAADASYATMVFNTLAAFGQRYSLWAHNFGFTNADFGGSAPASIDGIEFRVTRKNVMSGTYQLNDQYVYFVPAAATLGAGTNLADSANWSTAGDEQKVYGGATTLAGQTWAAADPQDTDFGIMLLPQLSGASTMSASATASVDCVECRVYYTASGGGGGTKAPGPFRRAMRFFRRR